MLDGTLLMPLAGKGSRYKKEGFKVPKPLIKVDGKPMILQAAKAIPEHLHQLFIIQEEHLRFGELEDSIKTEYQNAQIMSIDYMTEGQACTCMLAEKKIKGDLPLTIGACDNGMLYDKQKFYKLIADPKVDGLIWTFRNNPAVRNHPEMYGWVDVVSGSNYVKKVFCKKPISSNPMNDHAVIGCFTFKKASDYFSCTKKMITENVRINGEFYIDEAINFAIRGGLRIAVFEVDYYICWGTPNDLRVYSYWKNFFSKKLDVLASNH